MTYLKSAPSASGLVIVGDGSAQNAVTKTISIVCGCNAHAVRYFKGHVKNFPEEAGFALKT